MLYLHHISDMVISRNNLKIHPLSPFSIEIKRLRKERRLQQKEAADLLGYEQSYLSALEAGQKGPPKIDFVEKLAARYDLNDQEVSTLMTAWRHSRRNFLLPRNATRDDYEMWHALYEQTGRLRPIQVELIKKVLAMNVYFAESE